MSKLRILDLFSGIGGFSLGLERTGGFETVAFCEIEDYPRRVLAKHWPEVPCYEDVTKLTGDILKRDGISVDIITGGFPCQDISCAGRKAGIKEGTRSGLWSEIVRLIGEIQPRYVIVENVADLLRGPSEKRGGWFGRILGDLAESGYDAEWQSIPASFLGAPQIRKRVWVLAYPRGQRSIEAWDESAFLVQKRNTEWAPNFPTRDRQECGYVELGLPGNLRMGDGLPEQMDSRVKACGNAVVPQIPEMIGYAILEAEREDFGT